MKIKLIYDTEKERYTVFLSRYPTHSGGLKTSLQHYMDLVAAVENGVVFDGSKSGNLLNHRPGNNMGRGGDA